ncbi:MAG: lysophospholipase [Clostridia bacterium]|nr:lysophospholipase [Clostridia bacterium]
MKIEKASFTVESQLKPVIIHGFYYSPVVKANAKAVIQIAHGMAEHKERYDEFASFLAENGYAVFVHDHLGHGESVDSVDNLGFFGEEDGWKNLVNDCYTITKFAREVFPGKPVVLFGHSMGSFVARAYTQMYDMTLDAAIYCGTSGNNPAAGMGVKLADAIARSKGTKYKSELIDSVAFGTYNKKIKPHRTAFDWLSRDNAEIDKYVADDYCGFMFTACGFRDLFSLLKYVSGKEWYKSVRKSLPILFVSGDADPVGEYGKGVKQVAADLKKTGHDNVEIKLYKDSRHEILNDYDRNAVMNDILEWLDKNIEEKKPD